MVTEPYHVLVFLYFLYGNTPASNTPVSRNTPPKEDRNRKSIGGILKMRVQSIWRLNTECHSNEYTLSSEGEGEISGEQRVYPSSESHNRWRRLWLFFYANRRLSCSVQRQDALV